ncbi:MAG: alpha/beta hydrolase family protein [Acidobacteriaceae bacterium]
MFARLYAKWMYAWETALTTRDENRVERPLEWGFDHLAAFATEGCSGGSDAGLSASSAKSADFGRDDNSEVGPGLEAMIELNRRIVAEPQKFYGYTTPKDFRIEMHFPALYPTNVRPETLEQEREWKRRAEVGELRKEPFLRFTSGVGSGYPENDVVNARWYESAEDRGERIEEKDKGKGKGKGGRRRPKQAMIVMPQWNADAFSHNVLCEMFNRFGISCLRLSKPYHDVRRPAELERSDYAVSANVGRTIAACRQAVVDIRSCVDWLESQGYEQFGVLGTSLGSAYGFIAAAMDPRLRVCAFNHASTQFGDVVWTGQSTRHVKAAFEHAGLTQDQTRAMFAGVSPMSFMEEYAATGEPRWEGDKARRTLVVYAPYDLTFVVRYSREVLANFAKHGVDYVAKVLPCGHYTTGETPYKYLDGWYLGSFIRGAFKRLAE